MSRTHVHIDKRPHCVHVRPACRLLRLVLLLFIPWLLPGCDRPFVEPIPPDIQVVSPDLTRVFQQPDINLQLAVTSFRDVNRVLLNGTPMSQHANPEHWEGRVALEQGVNLLVVEATDVDGVASLDTLPAVYLPLRVEPCAVSGVPMALGSQSATRLADGRVLFTGGTEASDQTARDDVFLMDPSSGAIRKAAARLHVARSGHSGFLLPDGEVLIVGGSKKIPVHAGEDGIDSLVSSVERFDPVSETIRELVVDAGGPVRRTGGTGVVFQLPDNGSTETAIYLYGGLGDIRYGSSPRWGVRDDLRAFALENDTLFATGPPFGDPFEPLFEHTQTPIAHNPVSGLGRYLFAGSYFSDTDDGGDTSVFDMNFSLSELLSPRFGEPFLTSRRAHTATPLGEELVLFAGGSGSDGMPLSSLELYAAGFRRMLSLPDSIGLSVARFDHSATKAANNRIIITGGFDESGRAVRRHECVVAGSP